MPERNRAVRRQNAARCLLGRPNAEGRGTRVEIHPLGSQWGQYEYVTNVGFAA
ncbi:hypothetical protein GCM10010252_74310 [Streptomyces aureoverticillatus]|nr:hypothetical protein GCM10010252_74310 [Streptomyces aureoverticillatus]